MNSKKRILILSLIVFSLILMGIGTLTHADAASADTIHYYGVVKEGPLNVRSGPGVSYSSFGKLSVGTKVTVTAIKTVSDIQWYRITYQSKTGYICGTYVKTIGSQVYYSTAKTATVFQGPLNVRSAPSTTSAIIGSASYLKVVSVKSLYYRYESGKWLRITWNGKTGYMAAQYVIVNTAGSTIKKYTSSVMGTTNAITPLKEGPGTSYANVKQLPLGKSLTLIGAVTNPAGEKWLLYKYAYAIYYVAAKNVTIDTQTPTSTTPNAQKIVSLAYSKLGCDYVYGAEGPNTFDCSGFVYWVVNNSGISGLSVPRTSDDLYYKFKSNNIGTSIANAKPGDIILFSTDGTVGGISHSAIYYKDGTIIHASTPSTGVIITSVAYSTTNKSIFAIIRLPGV